MVYESTYERLLANSVIAEGQSETAGCWLWTGNVDRGGYGRLSVRRPGKKNPTGARAHRVMEEQFREEPLDPDQETIEHLCATTGCVNPDHCITVTRAVNTSLMRQRVRHGKR